MKALESITIQSPGTLGLNTQNADDLQDPRFCTQADNCIIARNGQLESRKGMESTTTTAAFASPIDVVYSYIEDDGTENIIWAGNNALGNTAGGDLSAALITGTLTLTGDDWQFQNYAGEVFGYQAGHAPIYWNGTGNFALLSAHAGTPAGLVNSHCHLSAYGRSWVVDTTTVSQINYSDLLVPWDFTNGSAGTIDLNSVWPYSNDTITCLAAHNNNLIIFCEKSIVIYGSAHDINNIYLIEVIKDIGCIARDSVQNIGDDIFFLSKDGVRSLARTILQDNMPQKEISAPIRDDMLESISGVTLTSVRTTYNEAEGFYLINFLDHQYICDVRQADQGIYRWTKWTATCYGVATAADNTLYFGLAAGLLSKYNGYNDTDTSDGGIDATYVMKYRSGWIDSGVSTSKCIWKRIAWYISSLASIQPVVTWAYDFSESEQSASKSLTGSPVPVYGTATYGTDLYGGKYEKQVISFTMSKTGSIVRFGFQSVVDGGKFAFNKLDVFFKRGRNR